VPVRMSMLELGVVKGRGPNPSFTIQLDPLIFKLKIE
jgi:hypothetical protein